MVSVKNSLFYVCIQTSNIRISINPVCIITTKKGISIMPSQMKGRSIYKVRSCKEIMIVEAVD